MLGLPGLAANDGDRFALMALSTLFGGWHVIAAVPADPRKAWSMLFDLSPLPTCISDSGNFAIYAGTSADQVDEMLGVVCDELKDVASGVSGAEVNEGQGAITFFAVDGARIGCWLWRCVSTSDYACLANRVMMPSCLRRLMM